MREQQLVAGGKRWHGSDFIDLQAECLTPLQKFFEGYGNVVISGCDITLGGGSVYTLNEGYVGCKHADGYKIAKLNSVSLGTTPTFPLYIKIDKTVETKLYDNGSTLTSVNVYTASTTTTTPGAGLYLTITGTSSSGQAPKWKDVLLAKNPWSYASSGIGVFVYMNGFIDGYAVTTPQDHLRCRNLGGNVWLTGAIDYSPLAAGPFGGYGLQITRLEAANRPDRIIQKSLVIALPGGTATILHTIAPSGEVYAKAVSFTGGMTHSDIAGPNGEFFEVVFPTA